jgi:tetratricopeptide (TPR) repeat protein
MTRKLITFYFQFRLIIAFVLIAGGIYWGVTSEWTFAWMLVLLGIIAFVTHFLLGNLRLVQYAVEEGDMGKAKKLMAEIKYPNLLIKPIRSVYHFMQSNIAMGDKDFDKAEEHIKKSNDLGMPMQDMDGMAIFQHGMISYQKGDMKMANAKMKEALAKGLSDKEARASANLLLCNYCAQRRDYRNAKIYFKKAKECKPSTPELVAQIKDIEKNIGRMPG